MDEVAGEILHLALKPFEELSHPLAPRRRPGQARHRRAEPREILQKEEVRFEEFVDDVGGQRRLEKKGSRLGRDVADVLRQAPEALGALGEHPEPAPLHLLILPRGVEGEDVVAQFLDRREEAGPQARVLPPAKGRVAVGSVARHEIGEVLQEPDVRYCCVVGSGQGVLLARRRSAPPRDGGSGPRRPAGFRRMMLANCKRNRFPGPDRFVRSGGSVPSRASFGRACRTVPGRDRSGPWTLPLFSATGVPGDR